MGQFIIDQRRREIRWAVSENQNRGFEAGLPQWNGFIDPGDPKILGSILQRFTGNFNSTVAMPLGGGTLRLVANAVDLDAENPGSLPQDATTAQT